MDVEEWVLANTRLQPVPFLPELVLWLGEDIVGLWERTEAWAGRPQAAPPFWAFAWAGGLGLARYVLDHPDAVRGRRILDLATGGGVVAVAASRAGAGRIVANDIDPLALTAARVNARANDVEVETLLGNMLLPADPATPETGGESPLVGFDVVLAGDVFYDYELADDVLPFLQRAAERGARVLVGDPGRRYLPRTLLLPLARYDVPVSRDLESSDLATVAVWWLPSRSEGDA